MTLAIILALVMGLAFAAPAMASSLPPLSGPLPAEMLRLGITKNLYMPPGTVIPNASFHFSFRQAVINANGDAVPRNPAEPQPMAVTIPNQIINFPADYVLTEADGWSNIGQLGGAVTNPAEGGFNLGSITWPHAGQFFFIVEELHNTNAAIGLDPLQSLSYSNEAWLLMVTVINYEGELRIARIQIAEADPSDRTWNAGTGPGEGYWTGGVYEFEDKVENYRPGIYVPGGPGEPGSWLANRGPSELRFRNDFFRTHEYSLTNPALAVSKAVDGPLANQERQFNFSLTLTIPPSTVLAGAWDTTVPVVATVTDAAGVAIPGRTPATIDFGTGMAPTATFTLSHGEQLRFPTLPIGTTYTVTEAATPNYAARATVTSGGTQTSQVGGITVAYVNQERVATGLVSNATAGPGAPYNLAAFLNTNHTPEIYGLFVGSMPFVIALFGATVILAMMVASRSRQRIEQLPIAY